MNFSYFLQRLLADLNMVKIVKKETNNCFERTLPLS